MGVPPMNRNIRSIHGQDARATHGRDAHATKGQRSWQTRFKRITLRATRCTLSSATAAGRSGSPPSRPSRIGASAAIPRTTTTSPLTDRTGSRYTGDFDAGVPSGGYCVQIFRQAGATPADTDTLVSSREILWTGTGELTAAKLLANKAVEDMTTETIDYYDDDGQTILLSQTLHEGASVFTRTPPIVSDTLRDKEHTYGQFFRLLRERDSGSPLRQGRLRAAGDLRGLVRRRTRPTPVRD